MTKFILSFFYEKSKYKTHSEEIKKCELKLMDIYTKIEEEIDLITKFNNY